MATHLVVAHTADLTDQELAAARVLIFDVFDDATEDDWEHCLGGMHALLWDGDKLLAHGAVIQRRLIHKDRALRTGYVEGVAVRADRKRQGFGGVVIAELERIIKSAYELGALGSSDEGLPFYAVRAWQQWRGKSYALTPEGVLRTPDDDDGIFCPSRVRPDRPHGRPHLRLPPGRSLVTLPGERSYDIVLARPRGSGCDVSRLLCHKSQGRIDRGTTHG